MSVETFFSIPLKLTTQDSIPIVPYLVSLSYRKALRFDFVLYHTITLEYYSLLPVLCFSQTQHLVSQYIYFNGFYLT